MLKVTKDTTIGDIVDNIKGSTEVLSAYVMHCFGCPMSRMESLEDAVAVHGVDVEEVLAKLNSIPETKKEAKKPAKKTTKTGAKISLKKTTKITKED